MERKRIIRRHHVKWTAGSLAMVAACVALVIVFFPLEWVRDKVLGEAASRYGREFKVEGPLTLDWHWRTPHVRAEKVRISNMPGSAATNMAEIEKVEFTFRLWPLLVGRLEIPAIEILHPVLNLERRPDGKKNWQFPVLSEANVVKNVAIPDDRHDMPLIHKLVVREGKVLYNDPARDIGVSMQVDTVEGKEKKAPRTFSLVGEGKVEGQKLTVRAAGGSLNLLRDTSEPFPMKIEIAVGGTKFLAAGTFLDPIRLKGLDAVLELGGPNLADLFYLMHIPFPPTPTYKLTGRLQKDGDAWTFSGFKGRVGSSDLSGTVDYNAQGERPLLSGAVHSNRMDVKDLGGLIGLRPAVVKANAKKGKNVLPDMRINLKRLRAGDMDLTLDAQKLNAPGWPLSDMRAHIKLDKGLLRLDPLSFGAADGRVKGFLEMDGRRDMPAVKMDLSLEKLSLKRFFPSSSFEEFSKGTFGGRIQLAGPGRSLAEVLGHSSGRVVAAMAGGKISLRLMEAADLDIAQLLPLLGRDRTTDVRCGITDFAAQDGTLKSRVFLLDTEDTLLKGNAVINLGNETLDIALDAQPKDMSIFSLQAKIRVTGKLANPQMKINMGPVVLRGAGAVVLGILAPPAALLPFVELGVGKDSDCAALLAQTKRPPRTLKAKK